MCVFLQVTVYRNLKNLQTFETILCVLFAKSELESGQLPPCVVILFFIAFICFRNISHSHNKWSVVCGHVPHTHTGSSVILYPC